MNPMIVARCPLCQGLVVLGEPNGDKAAETAVFTAHVHSHSIEEWVACVSELREEIAAQFELRQMPRCAMPRA